MSRAGRKGKAKAKAGPPRFDSTDDGYLYYSQQVTSNIDAIRQTVRKIGDLADESTSQARQKELKLLQQTCPKVREGKLALAELSHFIDYPDGERSMHRDKLTREFESILQKFQDTSRAVISRGRAQEPAPPGGVPGSGFDSYVESANRSEQQSLMLETQREDYAAQIRERDAAMADIENTMGEINDIYRDLLHLVEEQGEQLDTIEANMDNTDATVGQSIGHLHKAEKYQRSANKKALTFLGIAGAFLTVLILIIYFSTKKKDGSGSPAPPTFPPTFPPTYPPPPPPPHQP